MSVREIRYKIGIDDISPKTAQRAGRQNEHDATSVVFEFDSALIDKLKNSLGVSEKLTYRFDVYNEADEYFPSEENRLYIEDTTEIKLSLQQYMTEAGGKIRIYAVIGKLSSDNKPLMTLYTYSAILQLDDLPSGVMGEKKAAVELNGLIEQAKGYFELSRLCAAQASDSAVYARQEKEAAEGASKDAKDYASLAQTASENIPILVLDAESYASSAKKSAEDAQEFYDKTVAYVNDAILGGAW